MAEANTGANKYSGNSNRAKEAVPTPEKKVEKVIEGVAVQRKKSWGRKIAESFTGGDGGSITSYVLFEVVIPRVKDLIFDVGESTLRRSLFGDSSKGHATRSVGARGYTPYNTVSSNGAPRGATPQRPVATSSDEFGEIIVPDRGAAAEVMDKMANLIELYGMASVSDLKAAVGITGNFVDEKWGWVGMGGTATRRVGGANPGYLLIFPRPEELV